MRRRIDMAEVESATKIRAKYLRALESEEWELLPGPDVRQDVPAHVRGLPRAGRRLLVEEYKQRFERPAGMDITPLNLRTAAPREAALAPRIGPGRRGRARHRRPARARSTCSASRAANDDEREPPAAVETADAGEAEAGLARARKKKPAAPRGRCACSIVATGQVYVCMEDSRGRAIVDKETLAGRADDAHVPRPALQGHLRHRGGADPPEREELPRGRRARTRSATRCARAAARSGSRAAWPAARERPRRHRRHRHRGPVGDHPRPQRPVAGGAAARARGPARARDDRRRPPARTCAPRWTSSPARAWT